MTREQALRTLEQAEANPESVALEWIEEAQSLLARLAIERMSQEELERLGFRLGDPTASY